MLSIFLPFKWMLNVHIGVVNRLHMNWRLNIVHMTITSNNATFCDRPLRSYKDAVHLVLAVHKLEQSALLVYRVALRM